MPVAFVFVDGVGIGRDDSAHNLFLRASMPFLQSLLEGKRLVLSFTEIGSKTSAVIPLDACLGVGGLP